VNVIWETRIAYKFFIVCSGNLLLEQYGGMRR